MHAPRQTEGHDDGRFDDYSDFMKQQKPPKKPPRCPTCEGILEFTGLPDVSGPVYFRLYRCENCGIVRLDVEAEEAVGWG